MNSSYLLKLWLSTIATAPILIILTAAIFTNNIPFDLEIVVVYITLVYFGLIFSIPALILVATVPVFLKNLFQNHASLKRYYIGVSLITMTLTIALFFGLASVDTSELVRGLILIVIYAITILFFGKTFSM